MDEPSNELLGERLFAPALLADVIGPLLSGEELHARLVAAGATAEAERVYYRLVELWARIDPASALYRLDAHEAPAERAALVERLRAEALLEGERADEAAAVLERNQAKVGPVWELLRARLDFALHRRHEALARLDLLLNDEIEDELRASALGFRLRYRALVDDRAGAAADRHALAQLLDRHEAALSSLVFDVYGSYALLEERPQVVARRLAEIVVRSRAELAGGLDEAQADLGPLPLHVHGLFVKLRGEPRRLADLVTRLAGAEYLAGDHRGAYATLYYAARIAERLLAPEDAALVIEAEDELRRLLGTDQVAGLEAERLAASDAFLAQRHASRPAQE